VTSRDRLTPLVAAEGAYPLALDLLPADEARELLATRLGAERVAAEPAAVDEIIARCGRLPLALGIAAAHAVTRPHSPLAAEAAQLRDAAGGLDAFDGGDPTTDARVVFSWSYRALRPDAARLFRLLALHAGPDIAGPAAASLAGVDPAESRLLLGRLVRANLLTEPVPGRYRLHDLLRAYGTELVRAGDPDEDRRAAVRRVLDHYLHTAHAAAMLHDTARPPIALPTPAPGVTVTRHADREAATAWFAAEHPALTTAIGTASAHGFDSRVWTLAWTLITYLDWRGQWYDLIATQTAAVDALQRLGDRSGCANAHRDIGRTYCQLGRYADGWTHLHRALELYASVGDPAGEGRTHMSLGWMQQAQGHHGEALAHTERALELFRAAGDPIWLARSLNATGWQHAKLGRHRQARDHLRQALGISETLQDRHNQASTLDSLGYVHQQLGERHEVERCFQQALRLFREIGDHHAEAEVLTHLGDARAAVGDHESAHEVWERSLDLLQRLDHPSVAEVRRRLEAVRELRKPAAGQLVRQPEAAPVRG
jgi:tetratricopeptide (TPR) repeat protein